MAATFHPLLGLNAALSSCWLMGCGPVSGPSSRKHNTYRVPSCSVTDARLATYPGRSSPSKVWNSPQSSTVANLRPKRSSWNASTAANSTSIPRSSAFARAIASGSPPVPQHTLLALTHSHSWNRPDGSWSPDSVSQPVEAVAMADKTPSQPDPGSERGSGSGAEPAPAQGGRSSRPARQFRPGRGRRVGDAIMSVFVRAGLVPSTYLLTTRGRRTGRPLTHPATVVEQDGRRCHSHPAVLSCGQGRSGGGLPGRGRPPPGVRASPHLGSQDTSVVSDIQVS
jgi:hypothetical protein